MASSHDNEEKGERQNASFPVLSFLDSIRNVFSRSRVSRIDHYSRGALPTASQTSAVIAGGQEQPISQTPYHLQKLTTFRRVTGITSGYEHKNEHRPARNLGIYARVVRNEKQALNAFKLSSRIINGCLALQLIVAAALTALGAGNGPHAAVTVFGAVNTVIAGFLTYLKGSGLPNRHKFYASSWSKVREYMEQREREFEREDCPLDVEEVIRKVEDMYEEVRQDVEANEPEAYTSTGQLKRNEGLTPGPQISDKTGEFAHRPRLIGDRPTALSTARIASYGKPNIPPYSQEGYAQHSAFGDAKSFGLGAERSSNLDHRNYDLERGAGIGGGSDGPTSSPPPRPGDYRRTISAPLAAGAGFDASRSSYFNPYPPHLSPVDQLDHQTQEAIQASLENIRSAKRMEAEMEDTLRAHTIGIEKSAMDGAREARETMAREIEEERVQAARRMGDEVEMVKKAGEERVEVAKGALGTMEQMLSGRLKKFEEGARELI